jgi:type IV secretory pathway VirB10-like protein
MLDSQVPETPEEQTPPAASPEAQEPHEPPARNVPLDGRVALPSVKRFSRKAVILMSAGAAAVIGIALAVGLNGPTVAPAKPEDAAVKVNPKPGAHVTGLPTDYSNGAAAAGTPKLGPKGSGDFGAGGAGGANGAGINGGYGAGGATQLTPLQQYEQQRELDRVKNADQARIAQVSFTGGSLGASASPPPVGGSGSTPLATELQERLIDVASHPPAIAAMGTGNAPEDVNRQDAKTAYAEKGRSSDFDLHNGMQEARSPYTMFAGTVIPCVMVTGVNSDLPGQISCMVSQNVYDTVTGKYLLLPQGTKAIGSYDSHIAYGQDRVLVVWTRLLRPDGSNIGLEGMPGTDLSGYAGITGKVNNHYWRLAGGVVLGSIIGAGAQVAAGANSQNPSFSALAVQGAGQNINQAGQQITRKNLDIQPTIEVKPGERVNIFATRDIILPIYRERSEQGSP